MAISSQLTPRLLISQVGILASLEKAIPMGQLCMCAFQKKLAISPVTSCENYVHPPGGWIYYFCFFRRPMSDVRCPMSGVRRPMSGVTHGFRSFKGKVLELLSPNLVCRLIGSVAWLGLLLAVVPLLLTE